MKHLFRVFLVALSTLTGQDLASAAETTPPNIVVIMADDKYVRDSTATHFGGIIAKSPAFLSIGIAVDCGDFQTFPTD